MSLAEAPLLIVLAALAAYIVLGGADFGAGFWHMVLTGERRAELREEALRLGHVSAEEFDAVVRPETMLAPG